MSNFPTSQLQPQKTESQVDILALNHAETVGSSIHNVDFGDDADGADAGGEESRDKTHHERKLK